MKTEITEIKNSVDQILETLPPMRENRTIECPWPLGMEAEELANSAKINNYLASQLIGIERAPDKALDKTLRDLNGEQRDAEAKHAQIEAKKSEHIRAANEHNSLCDEIKGDLNTIAAAEHEISKAEEFDHNFDKHFQNWTFHLKMAAGNMDNALNPLILNRLIAREKVKALRAWLPGAKAAVKVKEERANALRQAHGIEPMVFAIPGSN